jgi:hypothetical protein
MELSLFDYDYTVEVNEESIQDALQQVITYFKECGNGNSLPLDGDGFYGGIQMDGSIKQGRPVLPVSIRTYFIPELVKRGYIKLWGGNDHQMMHLKNEYRDWHDPVEIAALFRKYAMEAVDRGCFFYDLYNIRTHTVLAYHGPGITEAVEKELSKIGEELGIEHYRKNPAKSMGHKMNCINKKNKLVIEALIQAIAALKTPKEVDQFLRTHAFEQPKSYAKGELEYRYVIPTWFKAACLAQTEDPKEILDILQYMGGGWISLENQKYTIIRCSDDISDMIIVEDEDEEDYMEDDVDLDFEDEELEGDEEFYEEELIAV